MQLCCNTQLYYTHSPLWHDHTDGCFFLDRLHVDEMKPIKIPIRYLPYGLSRKDKRKQIAMLLQSKKQYPSKSYFTRSKLASYPHRVSNHIVRAQKRYGISSIRPSRALSRKTGCSLHSLRKIVRKGEGAYYSSGSRPNQTAQSWGIARLASAITGGKSAAIDYSILEKGCDHRKTAYRLAKTARQTYGSGHSHTKRRTVYL